MSKTKLSQLVNNIVYVEPNYTFSSGEEYGINGVNTYEQIPSLEDYSIFVNLEVETRGRNVQATKTSNNTKLVMSYVSNTDGSSTVNFMQGTKIPIGNSGATINSLTTNYTDIFIRDLKKSGPTTEMFGIKSIDIAYNNYMVPEVTIEFVDVRGVSLFAQKEAFETSKNIDAAIEGGNQIDIANTFFQCFFTFPYPKFTLLVKGFYGQPVSYELTCADFRARFDSSTGNFACTAKFVGYYFSFLNDVMINGIVAAPYSDFEGSNYWEQKKFKLEGENGGEVDMPKIGWLIGRMKQIISEADRLGQSDPAIQEKIDLDSKKEDYELIENSYRRFVEYIKSFAPKDKYNGEDIYYEETNKDGYLKAAIILSPSEDVGDIESNNEKFKDYVNDNNNSIEGSYKDFLEALNKYNEAHSDKTLPIPDGFYNNTPTKRIFEWSNDSKKGKIDVSGNNDIKYSYPKLYESFRIGVNNANTKEGVNQLLSYRNAYFYNDNGFSDTLEVYKKKNGEKLVETEKKIENIVNSALAKALGFSPSVINMTKIIMAHFETFAYMILKTGLNICNEKPSRTISSLEVGDPKDLNDIKGNDINAIVPPFPKIVKETKRNGTILKEESWVGDYSGNFLEKDLIHGIINGINQVANDVQKFEGGDAESSEGMGSEGSTSSMTRYPLCPLDIIATESPYLSGGFDGNDLPSILGLVALRAFQIIGCNNYSTWGTKADVLGKAEAHNFLLDNELSKETKQKFLSVTANDVVKMLAGTETASLKKKNGLWPWNARGRDGMITSTGNLNLCRVQNYGYSVPYQGLSWEGIKACVVNSKNGSKAIMSENYINSLDYPNIAKKNVFTFDTNIKRYSDIVKNQLNGEEISGIGFYKTAFETQCSYSLSAYSNLITDGGDYIVYVIENSSAMVPTDGSCMLPTSKNVFSDKSFKGGYDMDNFNDEEPGDGAGGDGDWFYKDNTTVKRKGSNGIGDYLKNLNPNDFTFTEFPGVTSTLKPFKDVSIFGECLYYRQTSIKSRALLFLASLGNIFNYPSIISNYIYKDVVTMGVIPLPAIMFVGALLWSEETYAKKQMIGYTTYYYKDSITLLNSLRKDVKKRFMSIFDKWIKNGVEGDDLLHSFNDIREGLELHFENTNMTPEYFFTNIGEIEDCDINGSTSSTEEWLKKFGKYDSIMDFLKGELSDSFFRNYITIDEDKKGNTSDWTVGIRLGLRDTGPSVVYANNFALAGCVFSKNSKFFKKNVPNTINVNPGTLERFFDGFLSVIKDGLKETPSVQTDNQISQAIDPKASTTDIKIGIYRYCKMLYDKWIAGISLTDFDELWTVDAFFNDANKYFYFIDAFYNDADFIPINIKNFCDEIISCYRNEQYSVLSFLSNIYQHNKFNFLCVQNFLDLGKKENMKRMFDTVPYTESWNISRHPNFIVLYPYETSSHLADITNSEYENDGFMINQEDTPSNRWPEPLTSRNAYSSIKYSIPAFGVSYGKMYQSYFKDIDVSMDNPTVTEQSIKAQFAIASQNNEGEQSGDRSDLYIYGQDLYSIYSNNSYTCNVTMMGCAWVQPLMYFVLNNVPMFRGTYLIEKVWHHIEPGNMTTKFMGVRMANTCTRIATDLAARGSSDQTGEGEVNGSLEEVMSSLATIDNDCPYKVFPLTSDYGDAVLPKEISSAANILMKMIMDYGYSKTHAAGIVGNMYVESRFNEKEVVCDSKGWYSGGLCMWHNQALTALINLDSANVGNTKYKGISCKTNNKAEISNSLPSAKEQVNFLLESFEKDGVFKSKKWAVKKNLLATTTPEEAARVFQIQFERCDPKSCHTSEREKNARTFYEGYNEPMVKIEKNTDGHISDLATGFLNALNKTSNSSAEKVVIGVDSEKSSGDTLWLTNTNKSSRFGAVFDMILSAYSDKVSSVTWLLKDSNSYNSQPEGFLVTVKENSVPKILVATVSSPTSHLSSYSVYTSDNNSGMNELFTKALRKKYKSVTKELKQDTNNCISNYENIFPENNKIIPCNDVMKENGFINGETENVENEDGFIGDWNVGLFVNRLHFWQDTVCENKEGESKPRKPSNAYTNVNAYGHKKLGCEWCTSVVNRALRDSGLGMKYWGNKPWDVYNKMSKADSVFVEIDGGSQSNKTELNFDMSKIGGLRKGDVCVMWEKIDGKNHFHSCAFDGQRWYSDYVQNACNAYRGSANFTLTWHLFRHK